jgi:hypothetical protein
VRGAAIFLEHTGGVFALIEVVDEPFECVLFGYFVEGFGEVFVEMIFVFQIFDGEFEVIEAFDAVVHVIHAWFDSADLVVEF